MKRFVPLLIILITACASQPQQNRQQVAPVKIGDYNPESGPTPVGVIPTATLRDAQRNKDLEISIEYPTRGGPFPVIVFSPGYGGSSQSYEPLVSYWTSNGYVVIRPSHADAGALRELMRDPIREAYQQRSEPPRERPRPRAQSQPVPPPPFRPNPMETIWEKEREAQWRDRVADVKLVLDSLADLEVRFPELQRKMDRAQIGVGGHSYGAFAAMLIAGARTFGNPPLQLADPRVKAVIAMSPQGTASNRGLTPQSWTDVRLPVMYMTGSEDRGAAESEDANWRKHAFDYSPGGDKYFVLIEGARHSSFTGVSTAALEVLRPTNPMSSNPNLQPSADTRVAPTPGFISGRNLFQKIKVTSVIFWDAYLKNDSRARELLQQDKVPSGVQLTKK